MHRAETGAESSSRSARGHGVRTEARGTPEASGPWATTVTATGRRGRRAVTGGLGLSRGERENG